MPFCMTCIIASNLQCNTVRLLTASRSTTTVALLYAELLLTPVWWCKSLACMVCFFLGAGQALRCPLMICHAI